MESKLQEIEMEIGNRDGNLEGGGNAHVCPARVNGVKTQSKKESLVFSCNNKAQHLCPLTPHLAEWG